MHKVGGERLIGIDSAAIFFDFFPAAVSGEGRTRNSPTMPLVLTRRRTFAPALTAASSRIFYFEEVRRAAIATAAIGRDKRELLLGISQGRPNPAIPAPRRRRPGK